MRTDTMRKTLAALLLLTAVAVAAQQSKQPPPTSARPMVEETLGGWNEMGRKIIAMAEDFPEDKYDYKPTPDVRSFRGQLLHIAGSNYYFLEPVASKKLGDAENDPNPDNYKTKAAVVAYLKKSFEDGATLIKQGGAAGLSKEVKAGRNMFHAQSWWMWRSAMERNTTGTWWSITA